MASWSHNPNPGDLILYSTPSSSLNFISRTFQSRWNQVRKGKQPQPGWGENSGEAPVWVCAGWGAPRPHLFDSVWVQVYSLSAPWESCFLNHYPAVCNKQPSQAWCLGSQSLSNGYRWKVSRKRFLTEH